MVKARNVIVSVRKRLACKKSHTVEDAMAAALTVTESVTKVLLRRQKETSTLTTLGD